MERSQVALRMLANAWDERDRELRQAFQTEKLKLENHVQQLSQELQQAQRRIKQLEQRQQRLAQDAQQLQLQQSRFQEVRTTLRGALEPGETVPSFSPSRLRNTEFSPSFEVGSPMASFDMSSIAQASASSPSKLSDSRQDARKLFSEARRRLSLEQFGQFLSCVKQLNERRTSKEAALGEVQRLCGDEAADLHQAFAQLVAQR